MFIYKNIIAGDFLIKSGENHYKMKIDGWPSGGFSAPSDADALEIFRSIIKGGL
jgi:hypothetical protein